MVSQIHSAPANHRYSDTYDEDYCYNGGTHSAVIEDDSNYQTIHMTVSGYAIVRIDSNEDTVETMLAVEAVELTQSDDTNDGNVAIDVVETITETLSQTGIANGLKLVVLIAAGAASIAIWRKMRK